MLSEQRRAELSAVRPLPPEADGGSGSPASTDPDADRTRWLHTLVGQALDDIDEGRITVADALRLVVEIAWRDGCEHPAE